MGQGIATRVRQAVDIDERGSQSLADRRRWFLRTVLPEENGLRVYVRRRVANAHDVDEIVAETFIRMWVLPGWRSVEAPAAFVRTVARNQLHDQHRRRQNRDTFQVADIASLPVPDEQSDPEAQEMQRQDLDRLMQAIHDLPPRCREVFSLSLDEGLSNLGIAKALGLSLSTVEKHLALARRRCREELLGADA